MITLYGSFPAFGLPQSSPFVMKAEVQLKMAGVPYRLEAGGPGEGPKGKIPWIVEADLKIGDSTFIRAHIEKAHSVDLDRGLSVEQRAMSWAIERMLEDHLYWVALYDHWIDDDSFARGPAHFFDPLPEATREAARSATRKRVADMLHAHGLGRHSRTEVEELGKRSITALAILLGDKPYLMGNAATAVDATAFAMMASVLCRVFASPLKSFAESQANLVAFCGRMMRDYYPDFAAA